MNILFLVDSIALIIWTYHNRSIIRFFSAVHVVVACSAALLLVGIFGIIATASMKKRLLLCNIVLIAILCSSHLAISIWCLSTTDSAMRSQIKNVWIDADLQERNKMQNTFHCCGLAYPEDNISCLEASCCEIRASYSVCHRCAQPCLGKILKSVQEVEKSSAAASIILVLIEICGLVLLVIYSRKVDSYKQQKSKSQSKDVVYFINVQGTKTDTEGGQISIESSSSSMKWLFNYKAAVLLAQLDFCKNPNTFIFWAAEWEYIKKNWSRNTFVHICGNTLPFCV